MDVRCPQCATIFEFDERQLRVQLVTLKCSVCQHMFRLEVRLPPIQESSRRWMVRQAATGDVLYFGAFDTLHQWIMQQRIVADDAISRTGERWTRLAEMGEFAPVFQAVESINALSRGRVESAPQPVPQFAPQLSPPGTPQAGAPQLPLRDRSGTMQQFSTAPGRPLQPSAPLSAPQPPPQHVSPPAAQQPSPTGPQRVLPPRPRQPSAPPAPAPPQPAPMRHAVPASALSPQQASPLAPRTGPQRAVPAEEPWTIGDLSAPLLEQQLPAPIRPPSRALPIAVVLALLSAAGVAGAWKAGLLVPKPAVIPDAPAVDTPAAVADARTPTDGPAIQPHAPDLSKLADVDADADKPVEPAQATSPSAESLAAAPGPVASALKEAQSRAEREARRSDPKALAKDARRALDREQYAKARELFHQAIEEGEATPENVTGLGWALIGMGNAEAAVAQFNKALFLNAGYEDAYIGLAKAERQRGRLREALKVYERHLARFPDGRKASISRYQRDQLKAQLGEE
jgi:predicted Zn finger-like uncharacterized protein